MNNYHHKARQVVLATLLHVVLVILLVVSCDLAHTNATFQDRTTQLGLDPDQIDGYTSWGDYNNDCYVDLYAAGTLWGNNKGKSFKKVMTKGAGIWGDYNNDGYLDLFVWKYCKLLRNNQKGDFIQVSLPELPKNIKGASWADYDGDGYIDLYVGGAYKEINQQRNLYHLYSDIILMNKGDAGFAVKWTQSDPICPARGVTSCDFDNDGDMDVYVSNYFRYPNILWINDGTDLFENVAKEFSVDGDYNGKKLSYGFTIGSAWGDMDEDGYMDLFVGNLSHPPSDQDRCKFYKNLGPHGNYHFQDMTDTASLAWQESYASTALGDYDNDGDLDLFLITYYDSTQTSGRVANYAVLFRNDGNWHFKDVTAQEGLDKLAKTYQAAWADFDNDGDLDLVTDGKLFVNMGNTNNWIKFHLFGDGKNVNSAAIGAQVRIYLGDKIITRQVEAGTGEANQNDMTLHFGLGKWDKPVPTVKISWPNGVIEKIHNISVNRLHRIGFKKK